MILAVPIIIVFVIWFVEIPLPLLTRKFPELKGKLKP